MVAVRSAHLNTAGGFALDQWIASLTISNPQSCERLAETWRYCEAETREHPDQTLLLWRGIEMVEILTMLSMDCDSLCAALLFPLANAEVVSEEKLEQAVAFAKAFSQKTGAVIAITGAIDIVADQNTAYCIRNGHADMSKITGTESDS